MHDSFKVNILYVGMHWQYISHSTASSGGNLILYKDADGYFSFRRGASKARYISVISTKSANGYVQTDLILLALSAGGQCMGLA